MDSDDQPHHQAALDDIVADESNEEDTESNQQTALQALVDQYLTSKRTSGSHSYATSAESVLHRWAAWMASEEYGIEALNHPQEGQRVLNEYALQLAQRVHDGSLSPSTAQRYFAYVSACLSYGVRQGRLDRNPALTEAAKEDLPEQRRSDRTDQQFWSPSQREAIVSFVDDRATSARTDRSVDTLFAARDRALVRILAFAGVRGAEVFSHPKDDREGRCGLRWENVDLDAGTMLVFGKSQSWERTPLPSNCVEAVSELRDIQNPASEQWPVFTTGHAPSLYGVAREQLGGRYDRLLGEANGDIWQLLREHDIAPPPLTTSGARKVMQRLTDEADIDVEGSYLQLHGGRRGLGDLLYRKDRGHAQDILRHKDLATTQAAYQHIDAEERREQLDQYLEDE